MKQVKRVIQEKGPFAAVHAHTDFQSGFIALAARLAGVPVRICHSHSTSWRGRASRLAGMQLFVFRRLATLFGPRLAEQFGWHSVMGIALFPLMVVFILFIVMAKDSPAQPAPQPLKNYLHVFRQKETWCFCLLYGVTFGGFVGLSSFLAIFRGSDQPV